jgi:branched-subunit amino acid transport protein
VSWTAILLLAGLAYAFKALGLVGLDGVELPAWFGKVTALLPPALLAALVVVQTFGDGESLVLDARAVGLAAGCLAVWRRAPFLVVVIVAAASTAAVRAIS